MYVTDVSIGLSYNVQRSRVPLDITVLTNLGPAQTLHVPFAALIQQKEESLGCIFKAICPRTGLPKGHRPLIVHRSSCPDADTTSQYSHTCLVD